MLQIRFHGRGGQGVVTAAEITALAAFNQGYFAQAFPAFGVERSGAPIQAFARLDTKQIIVREQIYHPDIIVVQDASLLENTDISFGATKKTLFIINSAKTPNFKHQSFKPTEKMVRTIDATKIAMEIIGKNITNTVILGVLAREQIINIKTLIEAIGAKFANKPEQIAKNVKAITYVYEQ